jgi:hypothetical protein
MPKSSQEFIRLADDSSCPIPAEPTHNGPLFVEFVE